MSLFLIIFIGSLISISLLRAQFYLKAVHIRKASLDALYCAESAIQRAISALRANYEWREGFGTQNDPVCVRWKDGQVIGWYWIDNTNWDSQNNTCLVSGKCDIVPGPLQGGRQTLWIRAWGQDADRKVTRVLFVKVAIGNPADYFVSTVGDLRVGSGVNVSGDILGRNIIFEVNESLPPQFRSIEIDGNVLYINDIQGAQDPFVDIKGEIIKIPPITFTSVDANYYQKLAKENGRYIEGDFTISGNINKEILGASNGVVFVDGNLYLCGEVEESLIIIAAKNIYITGDLTCNSDTNAQIGLLACGDIIIPEDAPQNINIDALLIADGGVFKAEGIKGSKDTLNFEGVINVRGKEGIRI